jgi:hypothetical protein
MLVVRSVDEDHPNDRHVRIMFSRPDVVVSGWDKLPIGRLRIPPVGQAGLVWREVASKEVQPGTC